MKLYVVRHGLSEANKKEILSGWMDTPLTQEGIAEAEATALELPHDIDLIYSSDLSRCKDTAAILNKNLGLEVILDQRIKERNFGDRTGTPWSEDTQGRMDYDYRPYGGECAADVRARVKDFIADIETRHPGKNVLVVTHAGIVRQIHDILGHDVPERIHNASIHEFELPNS